MVDQMDVKKEKIDIDMYRYVSGLDIKLPKFNLKKNDAKEVFRLLNSGDKEDRKKAISLFTIKHIVNRYLEISSN